MKLSLFKKTRGSAAVAAVGQDHNDDDAGQRNHNQSAANIRQPAASNQPVSNNHNNNGNIIVRSVARIYHHNNNNNPVAANPAGPQDDEQLEQVQGQVARQNQPHQNNNLRQASRRSSSSNKTTTTPVKPPKRRDYIKNGHTIYSCIHCRAHLANHDELCSKLFLGNLGRAYLFNKVVNIGSKPAVRRDLLTGPHTVADIYCDNCETLLGWRYEHAYEPTQKYKEGKYIIELAHMLKENEWDPSSYNCAHLLDNSSDRRRRLIPKRSSSAIDLLASHQLVGLDERRRVAEESNLENSKPKTISSLQVMTDTPDRPSVTQQPVVAGTQSG